MRTTHHLQTRRLEGIDLHRDVRALSRLLREAVTSGTEALLRVRTRDGRVVALPLPLPSDSLRGVLEARGISPGVQAEGLEAEILIRNPGAATAEETFRDRNDERALFHDAGEADGANGAGERPGRRERRAALRHQPMFFRDNGSAVDLVDLYRGDGDAAVFLVLNGPSFGERERALLADKPGIVTFAVNNGGHGFRPHLWTCVDSPERFMPSIWRDGRIRKFVPLAHFAKDCGAGLVRDCPNTIGYRRNDAFCAERWLTEGTINWGNHKSRGGGRSVMLVALRIAFLLGFRRVYLVGCDFEMRPDHRYWFAEDRTPAAIRNNRNSYAALTRYYEALRPVLEAAGLEVWNCHPGSALRVFPFADLETAVREARVDVSGDTRGMYAARDGIGRGTRGG